MQSIESGRNLVALSCSIKLVNAIVSAEKRETPITDVMPAVCVVIYMYTHAHNVHIQCIYLVS